MTQPATPTPPPWQDTLADEGSKLLDAMREVTPEITEAVVRYVWAEGWAQIVGAVLGFIATFLLLRWAGMLAKAIPDERDGNVQFVKGAGAVACSVVALFAAGGAATAVVAAIPKILAPEGAAVMAALKALGGVQ